MGLEIDFNLDELKTWEQDMVITSQYFKNGRYGKQFLRNTGNKLKRRTVNAAKSSVNKRTGNLFKGIRRGRVYRYGPHKDLSVRVFGGKPAYHAHLLNYGHRIVDRNGKEHGFMPGYYFFEEGARKYKPVWDKDVQAYVDRLLKEGGMY